MVEYFSFKFLGFFFITKKPSLFKKFTGGVPGSNFGSGHDLMVCGFKPHIWLCTDSVESAGDSLSFPLSLPLPTHTFSLSQKYINFEN